MATRKPASVLPEPVGAAMSVSKPAAMSGHPWACGSVGPSGNRRSNHVRTARGCDKQRRGSPTPRSGGRAVVDDVEVGEGGGAVGQRHHLLRVLLRGRQVGVLHRRLVRVEERQSDVVIGVVTVLTRHDPPSRHVGARGCLPFVVELAHLVVLRRPVIDDLHEGHCPRLLRRRFYEASPRRVQGDQSPATRCSHAVTRSGATPRIRTRLRRKALPLTISTSPGRTPRASASRRRTAALARPPSGASGTLTLSASPRATPARAAPGWTWSETTTAPSCSTWDSPVASSTPERQHGGRPTVHDLTLSKG